MVKYMVASERTKIPLDRMVSSLDSNKSFLENKKDIIALLELPEQLTFRKPSESLEEFIGRGDISMVSIQSFLLFSTVDIKNGQGLLTIEDNPRLFVDVKDGKGIIVFQKESFSWEEFSDTIREARELSKKDDGIIFFEEGIRADERIRPSDPEDWREDSDIFQLPSFEFERKSA